MVFRKSNLVVAIAVAALLAQAIAANATIMTASETETFGLTAPQANFQVTNNSQNTPVVTNTNNGSQSAGPTLLNFNQFNSGAGTLLGVSVSFLSNYTSTSTLNVTSGPFGFNDVPGTINFFADGTFDFLLSGVGLIANQSSTQNVSATCAITYTAADLNDQKQCNNTATNPGNFNGTTPGVSLAPFIGSGTFNLSAALTSALLPRITPDNGTGFADNSTFNGTLADGWSGSVTVEYTFDAPTGAVPEPLTLYLLLAGLGGAALLPRRRS